MSESEEFMKGHSFEYQMLGRLQSDCEFYLGHGNRNARRLWAGNEEDQIREMMKIYSELEEKPVWISKEKIAKYAEEMGVSL